jgi:hypothetical protein
MKFPGCRRDVEINMWGGTSSRDELTGDFGDGREAMSIGVCDLFCRLVGKVVACILGLLQQNRPVSAAPADDRRDGFWGYCCRAFSEMAGRLLTDIVAKVFFA